MPSVANTVVVQNRTERAYFIGDVEVPAKGWGRVDPDHAFLATLVQRGDFRVFPENPAPAPVVEEQPAPTPVKKAAAPKQNSNKGDEE